MKHARTAVIKTNFLCLTQGFLFSRSWAESFSPSLCCVRSSLTLMEKGWEQKHCSVICKRGKTATVFLTIPALLPARRSRLRPHPALCRGHYHHDDCHPGSLRGPQGEPGVPDCGECGDEEVCEFPKTSCVIVGFSCLSVPGVYGYWNVADTPNRRCGCDHPPPGEHMNPWHVATSQ